MTRRILILDLDHTFIKIDLLKEAISVLLFRSPLILLRALFWFLKGDLARGKSVISQCYTPKFEADLVRPDLLEWVQKNHPKYEKTYIVSASPQSWVDVFAKPFGFIDGAYGSSAQINLRGPAKLKFIEEKLGPDFAYAGDSSHDLSIWKKAGEAIVLGSDSFLQKVKSLESAPQISLHLKRPESERRLKHHIKLLRAYQWSKNALVFLPLLLAGRFQLNDWISALYAFVAFSLSASAVYIVNDLADLNADRGHRTKRRRPLAAGLISPLYAILVLVPLLVVNGVSLSFLSDQPITGPLAGYLLLTSAYSFVLKRIAIVDVLVLSSLYTLRIYVGAYAASVPLSDWLILFSLFFFLSLALVKRFSELRVEHSTTTLQSRGYRAEDTPLVLTWGLSVAMVSCLVFALYLNELMHISHYPFPQAMWGAGLVTGFWLSYVWLKANRGEMTDDPVVFALKDRVSLFCGFLIFNCAVMATGALF